MVGFVFVIRLSFGLFSVKIVVIEVGFFGLYEDGINVFGLKGSMIGGKYDWYFLIVFQKVLNNWVVFNFCGKVFGGLFVLNLFIWDCLVVREIEKWKELGNLGWGWKEMEVVMEKVEMFVGGLFGLGIKGLIYVLYN